MKKFKFRYIIDFEGKSIAVGPTPMTEREIDSLFKGFLESLEIYHTKTESLVIKFSKQKPKNVAK